MLNRIPTICSPFVMFASLCMLAAGSAWAQDALANRNPDGWIPLFDGKSPQGWTNPAGDKPSAGWVTEDGALVCKGKAGDIWTKQRFGNFVLALEFRTKGNSVRVHSHRQSAG